MTGSVGQSGASWRAARELSRKTITELVAGKSISMHMLLAMSEAWGVRMPFHDGANVISKVRCRTMSRYRLTGFTASTALSFSICKCPSRRIVMEQPLTGTSASACLPSGLTIVGELR